MEEMEALGVPANAPAIRIPTLQDTRLDPMQFAQSTCFPRRASGD